MHRAVSGSPLGVAEHVYKQGRFGSLGSPYFLPPLSWRRLLCEVDLADGAVLSLAATSVARGLAWCSNAVWPPSAAELRGNIAKVAWLRCP